MSEIICYTNHLPEGDSCYLSLLDILLDDTWVSDNLVLPESIYSEIGDYNHKLGAKQTYEFVLRAAYRFPIKAVGISSPATDSAPACTNPWDEFCTDCYVTGKYQSELLTANLFNSVVESLILRAQQFPHPNDAIQWLEKMISHSSEYYEIDDNTQPILIYKTSDICLNLLNIFAEQLASAFKTLHQRVEIFDVQQEGHNALTKYIHIRFKAIIGIQSYLFSIMMQDQINNLHDLIIGPKYNMLLDHPAWIKDNIKAGPQDYTLLIHDRDYISFCRRYYSTTINYEHFYPAGLLPSPSDSMEKIYDIVFIGTYRDYRERLEAIRHYKGTLRFIASHYLGILKRNPNGNAEQALHSVLEYYHIHLCDSDFLDLFYDLRDVYYCIMIYYREKVIQQLLDSGLSVHVYGNTWEKAPFCSHPALTIHPKASINESLTILKQARISLNIMSWHKDGFTERIANSMLCHSLVVSDKSRFLEENFTNGKDLLLFDLTEIEKLPQLIKNLLSNPQHLASITESGYSKALNEHQWLHRARQLLKIIDESSYPLSDIVN